MPNASLTGRFPGKRAVIDESTAASNEIVAAVAGRKIVVTSVVLVCAGAVALTWQSASTALSGAMPFGANQGYSQADPDAGLFETVQGEALNLLSGGAVQHSGYLTYVEVS